MKELIIEWRHYANEGKTCDRCSATGSSTKEVVAELTQRLADKRIKVVFRETVVPEELMAQSNLLLFNGTPLENLLEGATASENTCPSCSCLTGQDTSCRTVEHEGVIHEEIPAELIRRAAMRAVERITN